jgi:hypothetical protein
MIGTETLILSNDEFLYRKLDQCAQFLPRCMSTILTSSMLVMKLRIIQDWFWRLNTRRKLAQGFLILLE